MILRFIMQPNTVTFVQSKTILADVNEILKKAKAGEKHIKKQCNSLSKLNPRKLDNLFHVAHEEVFDTFDCLQCAQCCITTGPLLTSKDIDRAASALDIKPGDFVGKYMKVDEDGDYVFKSLPCPFLHDNKSCSIYEDRPRACREYPHTNRTNMYQILQLTQKNALICPAVFLILEKISVSQLPKK